MDEREDERRRLVAETRSFTSIGLFSDSIFAAWAYGVQKPAFDAKNDENTRTDTTERAVKKRKDFFRSRAKPFIFSANVRKCPRSTCRTSSGTYVSSIGTETFSARKINHGISRSRENCCCCCCSRKRSLNVGRNR